jgi:hypothetical protein
MKRQAVWVLACLLPAGLAAAVVILGAMHSRRSATPPPVDVAALSPDQIMARMKSGEIRELSPQERRVAVRKLTEDREEFREMMHDEALSEEEREQLRDTLRETFREEQREQVKEYFSMSPEDRDAYLERLVDEMAERFRERAEGGGPPHGPPPGGDNREGEARRGPTPERIRERIENTDPVERAQQAEFRRAMHEKMAARGHQPPRPR